MAWTSFIPPYPNGYENGESGGTPVTAEILNTNYDAFLLALNSWAAEVGTDISNKVDKVTGKQLSDENYTSTEKTKLAGIAEGATAVVANPSDSSSTNLTKIKIGGSVYLIPQGGSGGSSVSWTQIQATGTKIATITIDGVPTDVYAPNGGSGGGDSVSWSQVVQSGTKIGTITINNVATDVYVPAVPTNTSDLTNDSNFVSDSSYVHTDNNYTTTEKNKLADLNQVVANPSSGTSAGDLSSISIGGTKYDIPTGGGGGTTVVANPSGEATDELEKLQVGSTIYSIPEGGGSGEGWIDIKGTLTAGQTSITLTSSKIKTTSVIDYYTSIFGVSPTAVTISDGSATLAFEAQATDMNVMISVRKLSEEKLFDLPLSALELNKIWFAYDGVRGFTHVLDTLGDGLRIYGGESANDWTTSGSVCIDLTEFSSVIPSSLTAMKFHFLTFTLTDYAAVRFFISNTKYEDNQQGSDAMLRSSGFAQIESSDSLDSSGFYTAQIDSQTLSGGRYLYIMVMTGSVGGTQGYGNGYNGTFDVQVDGIDFVTGGN